MMNDQAALNHASAEVNSYCIQCDCLVPFREGAWANRCSGSWPLSETSITGIPWTGARYYRAIYRRMPSTTCQRISN